MAVLVDIRMGEHVLIISLLPIQRQGIPTIGTRPTPPKDLPLTEEVGMTPKDSPPLTVGSDGHDPTLAEGILVHQTLIFVIIVRVLFHKIQRRVLTLSLLRLQTW